MMGGMGGMGDIVAMLRGGTLNADSMLTSQFVNPLRTVMSLRDSLQLTEAQAASVTRLATELDSLHAARKTAVRPVVDSLLAAAPAMMQGGGGNPQQMMQQLQLQIQPQIEGGRRETAERMQQVQRELSAEQWAKLPESVRGTAQQRQQGGFNAVAFLDRMLANPLPVLLELKTQLNMTPEQVTALEKLSTDLQVRLAERREELGRRFDNVQPGQAQGQLFQQMQPQIEQTRREITEALRAAEKILTAEQWRQVPQQIREPFQQQQRGPRGG